MAADDIADLRARAEGGDAAAMAAFGKSVLAGEARDLSAGDGVAYIARAAESGDAGALAQLAVLVAAGMHGAANWERALDLLQRAAVAGSASAQDDLRLLSGAEGDDFAAMRAAVDVRAWMRPPQPNLVSRSPHILTAEGFMSRTECSRMIARVQDKMKRADVFDPSTGGSMVAKERSNSKYEMGLTEMDLPFLLLHARMSAIIGLPANYFEPTNFLHYKPGEQFTQHYDFLDNSSPGLIADMQARGQRVVTFLVYLNEGYDGGETDFPRVNYRFKGKTGDALMFGNVGPNGAPDLQTLHAGLPPTSGEKWLLSQWVRNRAGQRPG